MSAAIRVLSRSPGLLFRPPFRWMAALRLGRVAPEYTHEAGDTIPRDCYGVGGTHYVSRTGRNDLAGFKVAGDANNLYFYARTRQPLTPATDPNWMWLLIDIDGKSTTGWEGYDWIVNRTIDSDGLSWLEKNTGGWKWEKVVPVTLHAAGNELEIAIPRKVLGLREGPISINFKWADNLQHPGDVMDFYLSGSVAPEGRFAYRYSM